MKVKIVISLVLLIFGFSACESDDISLSQPFVIGFSNQSHDFAEITSEKQIRLEFSEPAKNSGVVTIKVTPKQAQYGVDFATEPSAENGTLELQFNSGDTELFFTFKNLIYPFDADAALKEFLFEVVKIDYSSPTSIQGYTSTLISFGVSLGATLLPDIGGPNQGDQLYIDLSKEKMTKVRRDSWDLGFYCGEHSRVVINGSIYMAAKNLGVTNIDAVTQASVQPFQNQVAIGTFDPVNANYVDNPNGNILQTAIAEISANNDDNKVYLVNLGYEVGNTIPAVGSVAIAGNARGWKKIRILKSGENYILQYANLNSTTHQEVTIPRNAAYNFTFFSFNTQNVVPVEPEKTKWDLNFTVFTNEIEGAGSYGYSDFVVNNLKGGVKGYRVNTTFKPYSAYALADVDNTSFVDDQRVIGSDWRDVFTGIGYTDRYFILKDADGNHYKIRMLGFLNNNGVRGYPKFEYQLLQ